MPKMKSHRGAAKRFEVTGGGKLKRRRANKNHILEKKPSTRTRVSFDVGMRQLGGETLGALLDLPGYDAETLQQVRAAIAIIDPEQHVAGLERGIRLDRNAHHLARDIRHDRHRVA